ncbi:MAG: DUF3095 family protein [Pseudomonadota bacterium]
MSDIDKFYGNLNPSEDFDTISDGLGFMPLPDDWTVLISDVVNSTGAIERGEYKSVNMVGAASIVAVLNGCDGVDVPFMFGGDGGVVAVPPGALKAARTRLGSLQDQCEPLFGLTLRAAAIPVHELRRAGTDVQVRKFQLAGNNHLAMFAGGGLELADKWLKDEAQNNWHLSSEDAGKSLDLEGLSCRWQPLQARNGVMLTVILQTAGNKVTTSQINKNLTRILGKPINDCAPVQNSNLKLAGISSPSLAMERAALRGRYGRYGALAWTTLTYAFQSLAERYNRKYVEYDAPRYREELKANTDFRKFDGALRLVIDVTVEQADEIERFLESGFAAGNLNYGTWRSEAALMTCLLFDLAQSLHVHFIDGANGGYTQAAKAMKARAAQQTSL